MKGRIFPLNKDSTNLLQFRILYRRSFFRNIRQKKMILISIMKEEQIVVIIIKQTGLSRKEIYEMTEKKKKKCIGPISNSVALFQIVKDLCIRI